MIFFTPFLLSISFNLDTLFLSSFIKSCNAKIYKFNVLFISIFTTIATFLFMYLGKLLSFSILKQYSNIFGCILLSFIGLYYLIEYIRIQEIRYGYDTSYYYEAFPKYKNLLIYPEQLVNNKSNSLTLKNTLLFSLALSINNCLIGFAGGIIGLSIPIAILLNFILAVFIFIIGSFFEFSSVIKKNNYLFSSIILILIGIFKMYI